MRFVSLGSGSGGNATLIEAEGTRILLDCGFAARELERRIEPLDVPLDTLDAILVTHEHMDHIQGVGPLARRYKIPVWMTAGTYRQGRCGEVPQLELFNAHSGSFSIGAIEVTPFPVPHDAREPVQFLFASASGRLGVLTDSGHWTPHILDLFRDCDALMLECNHDSHMLAIGPYPPALQRRVGGAMGHLSNEQAAEFVQRIGAERLQHLLAVHLSEKNNAPQRVKETLLERSPDLQGRLSLALQGEVTPWFEISASCS
jgi:phosphoribosyl 1,2-cyclic phosphodiesterase